MSFRKIAAYLKALRVKGGVLTAVGLLPFFIDDILRFYLGISLNIPIALSLAWFILAFGWANFSLYTKLAETDSLVLEIVEMGTVSLKGIEPSEAVIDDTIIAGAWFVALVSSPKAAKSVRFFIDSVEPNCLVQGGEAEITLRSANGHLENPCWLREDEMKNIQLTVTIPLSTACLEQLTGSLSRFKEMTIVVGAEQSGSKPVYQPVHCDLLEAHNRIFNGLAARIQHFTNARFPPTQFLSMLQRYWQGVEAS